MTSLAVKLDLLGTGAEILVADVRAAEHLRPLIQNLPSWTGPPDRSIRLTDDDPSASGRRLYDGETLVATNLHGPFAVRALLWYLNQLALRTREHLVLHAGAVAKGNWSALFPADMDAGKSTLVTALVLDGMTYLSDEFAPISIEDGRLHPYPSPIGLDVGSFPLFPGLSPPADTEFDDHAHWNIPVPVDQAAGRTAFTSAAIVFPHYRAGAPCTLRPISPATATVRCANQALNLHDRGRQAFEVLSRLARTTPAYSLEYATTAEACGVIRTLSDGHHQ